MEHEHAGTKDGRFMWSTKPTMLGCGSVKLCLMRSLEKLIKLPVRQHNNTSYQMPLFPGIRGTVIPRTPQSQGEGPRRRRSSG